MTCGILLTTFKFPHRDHPGPPGPKHFVAAVYFICSENGSADEKKSKGATTAKIIVITRAVTVPVTIRSMRYVDGQIDEIEGWLIYARQKVQQAKFEQTGVGNVESARGRDRRP